MTKLSIIIVNYNAKDFLLECLQSFMKHYQKEITTGLYELLISDNNSSDGSVQAVKKFKETYHLNHISLLENKENLGFSKGNNVAVAKAKGNYILFLNPDTVVYENTLPTLLQFMEEQQDAGAVTCQVKLPNGSID